MTFIPDKETDAAVYEQIFRWLEGQIKEGILKTDEKLPSERKLSNELGVARNTVKQAYAQLCASGFAKTVTGSGTYVCEYEHQENDTADGTIKETVSELKQMGVGLKEAQRLFLECAWKNLHQSERLRMAWVDCTPELLCITKAELERFCNIAVTVYTLDDLRERPEMFAGCGYTMVATTINHFDEVKDRILQIWEEGPLPSLEKVVLSLGANVISHLVQMVKGSPIAVVYDSEWLRYSIECYLSEFRVESNCIYITIEEAVQLIKNQEDIIYQYMILPPDPTYKDGIVGKLAKELTGRGIKNFYFEQKADQGSLYHVKKRAQECWSERGRTE